MLNETTERQVVFKERIEEARLYLLRGAKESLTNSLLFSIPTATTSSKTPGSLI